MKKKKRFQNKQLKKNKEKPNAVLLFLARNVYRFLYIEL